MRHVSLRCLNKDLDRFKDPVNLIKSAEEEEEDVFEDGGLLFIQMNDIT